jgi:hypothetical protein
MNKRVIRPYFLLLALFAGIFAAGCSVEASKATPEELNSATRSQPAKTTHGATISIDPNGPADTVRAFYKLLREKKFREAIFLTNLRPAIEGLTDAELKEFDVDFESIAGLVPAEIEINGEIVTGEKASVTAKLPADDDKMEIQEIKLRKEGDIWVILSADDDAEKRIKKEGKNYFFALRIETHEDEARQMLDRISKAEMVYALQNGGLYGDIIQLVKAGLLPDDAETADSTGYKYSVALANDKKSYSAKAEPAAYAKSGKLTFTVELNDKRQPHLTSKDYGK